MQEVKVVDNWILEQPKETPIPAEVLVAWQKVKELAQLSHNTGSPKLCRSCIKVYACILSGDNVSECGDFEQYSA
jgi:hypothetical protein